jgi:cytochrome c peroxidase
MNSGARRCGRWWLIVVAAAGILAGGGAGAQQADDEALIEEGRRLFLKETFDGNGRTCATCHPPTNNFTIDPEFIRTLRGNDPLFVKAPSEPDLKDLEVKRLLQRFGLVLENVDGLDQPGVLRSVPHTLGLSQSIVSSQSSFANATGWSGDGSPRDGSLRSFSVGAVIQHFTKSLNRVEGVDFRLPTDAELDALEAFQLSLGRQKEVNIDPPDPSENPAVLVFTDDFVEDGKFLFDNAPSRNGTPPNGRSCAACHNNAGANNAAGVNRNFATGTMFLTNAPGCLLGFVAPGDGGFGVEPADDMSRRDLCGKGPNGGPKATVQFQGDLTMNTPSLIEAADTPPFFHNNSAATIEDAVAFYTTDTFNSSRAGAGNAFMLTEEQTNQIAALLRALNALQNVRSSNAYSAQALRQPPARAEESVELAIIETTDAIEVLTDGPVELFAGTDTISLLEEARALERQALAQGLPNDALLKEAIALRETARGLMIELP